jgi:hypothetical protein
MALPTRRPDVGDSLFGDGRIRRPNECRRDRRSLKVTSDVLSERGHPEVDGSDYLHTR